MLICLASSFYAVYYHSIVGEKIVEEPLVLLEL